MPSQTWVRQACGGQADRAPEQADELECRQADFGRQFFQPKIARIVGAHKLHDLVEQRPVAWPRFDPAAPAAMALKQPAERTDQKLAFVEDIPPLLDRPMHGEEAVDQVGVAEQVTREVRHGLDARLSRYLIECSLRGVERSILPAFAPPHPAGVWLGRIEDEQGRGLCLRHFTTALDDRTASLGHHDDQSIMCVRRIFVRGEVRAKQGEIAEVAVPPIPGRVPGVAPSHASRYRAGQFEPRLPAKSSGRSASVAQVPNAGRPQWPRRIDVPA